MFSDLPSLIFKACETVNTNILLFCLYLYLFQKNRASRAAHNSLSADELNIYTESEAN